MVESPWLKIHVRMVVHADRKKPAEKMFKKTQVELKKQAKPPEGGTDGSEQKGGG